MKNPDFHVLYSKWVESEYSSKFKPSFDRLDDYISYRLNNIQVTTWDGNNQKGYASRQDGRNTKKSLAVDMLDLQGNFIERFHSVSEAARRFNGIASNIIGAINHRTYRRKEPDGTYRLTTTTKAYGHKWRYSTLPNDNSEIV